MENMGTDWINNLIFAVSDPAYKLTPRYKTALKMYKDAMNKYPNYQFDLLGHSRSIPMNKNDKLLVIDPKLLISGGSSIHSNNFNPITDEEDL